MKLRAKLVASLGVLLAVCIGPDAVLAQPDGDGVGRFVVARWTTADGLPQNSITDIAQDQDGYLWLTTFGGLARFDGTAFDVFDMASRAGLDTSRFLSVAGDGRGGLWLGSERRGLIRFVDGAFAPGTADQRLATAGVGELVQRDGVLWASTSVGLARLEGEDLALFGPADGLQGGTSRAVSAAPDGAVWVGTLTGPLCWSGPGCAPRSPWTPPQGTGLAAPSPLSGVYAFAHDAGGTSWALGEAGLHGVEGGAGWRLVVPSESRSYVGDVVADPATGRVWFSDGPKLFVREADGAVRQVPLLSTLRPDEAATYPIRSLLLDREGSLWVGVDGAGLFQVRDRRIVRHGLLQGLSDPSVRTVLSDPSRGRLWVGSGCGALRWLEDGVFGSMPLPEPHSGCVRALALDASGDLWFGANGRLYHLRGEELTFYDVEHGLPEADLLAILPRDDGSLLLGTGGRGVFAFVDGHAARAFESAGLDRARVPVLVPGPSGGVWIGTDQGVSRVGDGPPLHLGADDGLSPGAVRDIHVDEDGSVWIGTYGGGMTRWRDGAAVRFTRSRGLCDDVVSRILDGGDEALWMNGNRGLFRVPRSAFDDVAAGRKELLPCVLLESGEGNGGAAPAGDRSPDGRLWLPTIAGVAEVDPSTIDLRLIDPLVSLQEVAVDGRRLDSTGGDVAPPGRGDLSVRFAGLDFAAPGELRFRHRLVGHDANWVDDGPVRVARYVALPPGPYRFEVQSRSARGGTSDVAAVEFSLAPHLWERWWFLALLAGVLLLAVSGGWSLRLRGLRRHAAALEAEVTARKELAEQLRQAEKAEAMGQLAGGVAHDFNNVLMAVAGFADLLAVEVPAGQGAEHLEQIQIAAERGMALSKRLLALGRRQASAPEALDVGALVEDLRPMLNRVTPSAVRISVRRPVEVPPIQVDRVDLEHALLNLIVNARDAMPDGGTIIIETTQATLPAGEAAARGVQGGAWTVLAVSDSGEGMGPELQSRVFDPFFTTKPADMGTGLGLATVQRVVRDAGGFVTLESTPGSGTTFRLWFPAGPGAEAGS